MTDPVHGDINKPRSAATSRGDRMTVARDRMLSESLTGCVGLRTLCLEKEVQRLVEDLDRQRQQALIAELPGESRAAVKEIGAMVENAVLLHLGQELEGLRTMAGRKVAAQEVDLGNQRAQIRDLLSKVDHMAAEIADLDHAKLEVEERLAKANSENAALKTRVADLQKEQDLRGQMLELVKETLQQPVAAE